MTVGAMDSLPVLDFRTLTDDQIATAETIFNEFRKLDLQAGLPGRHRPQPRPAGPSGGVRPAGVWRGYLPCRPPTCRQVVRRAVGAWGQKAAAEHRGDHLERVGSLLQQGGDEGTVRRAISLIIAHLTDVLPSRTLPGTPSAL